jgi:hypothetical protein
VATLTEDDDDMDGEALEIIEVDDDGQDIAPEEPEAQEEAPAPEPEAEGDDEDDDDEGDARLADEEEESGTPADRKKRRREQRRLAQKRTREMRDRELAILREQNRVYEDRLAALEGHAISSSEQTIAARIAEARQDILQAERIMAAAVEAGNGEDLAAALNLRDEAKAREADLRGAKERVEEVRARPAPPSPAVQAYATAWVADNASWYNQPGYEGATREAKRLDQEMLAAGYQPHTPEYWEELSSRVNRRFREMTAGAMKETTVSDKTPRRQAPPMGRSSAPTPTPSSRTQVRVTPERKQAMIEAGIWDDPVRRDRVLRTYRDYDRNSAS